MSIHPSGTFDYEVTGIERTSDSVFVGKGKTLRKDCEHPGIGGYEPTIEVRNGIVGIFPKMSEKPKWWRNNSLLDGCPVSHSPTSFEVGDLLQAVLRTGDHLFIHRFDTGDLAVVLFRQGVLELAVGAVVSLSLGKIVRVEHKGEIRETNQLHVTRFLNDPEQVPSDLHLLLTVGKDVVDLSPNSGAFIDAYYVHFERPYLAGIPGKLAVLAISRMSAAVTKEMVKEAALNLESGRLRL